MNDKDVAFFGTLLNESGDNVKQYAEEGTLGEKVSALGLLNKSQVDTLKENYAKEVRSSHLTELADLAKKGEIPQDLYKPINGAVLEMKEKAFSKKYGIADYEGFDDLVEKAISKNKGQSDDKRLQEMEVLIDELKGANKTLLKEKEEAEINIRADFESKMMSRDMDDLMNRVPFDFSDVDADDLDKTSEIRKRMLRNTFDATYDTKLADGKLIVTDKKGEALKNPATLEPIPATDVINSLAKELGMKLKSPESGGQGGSSSGNSGSRFKNVDEFSAYCRDNGIVPTSAEGLKLLRESGLKLY